MFLVLQLLCKTKNGSIRTLAWVFTSEFWREFQCLFRPQAAGCPDFIVTRESQLRRQQHSSGPSCRTSTCPEPAQTLQDLRETCIVWTEGPHLTFSKVRKIYRLLHLQLRTDPLDPYPFRLGVTAGLDGSAGLMRATSVFQYKWHRSPLPWLQTSCTRRMEIRSSPTGMSSPPTSAVCGACG